MWGRGWWNWREGGGRKGPWVGGVGAAAELAAGATAGGSASATADAAAAAAAAAVEGARSRPREVQSTTIGADVPTPLGRAAQGMHAPLMDDDPPAAHGVQRASSSGGRLKRARAIAAVASLERELPAAERGREAGIVDIELAEGTQRAGNMVLEQLGHGDGARRHREEDLLGDAGGRDDPTDRGMEPLRAQLAQTAPVDDEAVSENVSGGCAGDDLDIRMAEARGCGGGERTQGDEAPESRLIGLGRQPGRVGPTRTGPSGRKEQEHGAEAWANRQAREARRARGIMDEGSGGDKVRAPKRQRTTQGTAEPGAAAAPQGLTDSGHKRAGGRAVHEARAKRPRQEDVGGGRERALEGRDDAGEGQREAAGPEAAPAGRGRRKEGVGRRYTGLFADPADTLDASGHSLRITGPMIWCAKCGRYALRRVGKSLKSTCKGVAEGAYYTRLARLREGRHPLKNTALIDS